MPVTITGRLPLLIAAAYLALISLISVIVTVYDKWAAKRRPSGRIRESSLIALSVVGGSAAMLLTMLIIRHKTRHPKFMIGIPLILIIQAALIYVFANYMSISFIF
ncbi:MAG TPA: DUF1294 domain-containing protein [Clostridiales bacterium]|nr:DUF1294 domain-containing protein [Clostridiales bacterium]MDD7595275.1 DUF1294 domain-containing protein [Clostridiales bacterium]HCG68265.1 DUF1294 domain-containing protein [Clostridiales bacterium]